VDRREPLLLRGGGASQFGNLVPGHMRRVRTAFAAIVEERDDGAVVCFVNPGDAPARQQTAGESAKNSHRAS